jgi:multiple sugar transport system substrate-binding protein
MTTITRRRGAVTAIAVMSVVALAACGGGGSEEGGSDEGSTDSPSREEERVADVTVGYSAGSLDAYLEAMFDRVEEELGVTVTPVVYPTYDDQLNQLPNQFAGQTAPDIILWDNAAPVAQYAAEGVIRPVDDLLADSDVDLSAFPQALVDGWTLDGGLYAVPSYLQNSAMIYNMDVLSEAGVEVPTTVAELGEAAQQVKDATGKAGIVVLENLFHLTQYVLAFGGGWDYGRSIDSPANVEAIQWLADLYATGAAASAQALGATWDGEAIAAGTAAMSDGGPWYIGFMAGSAPDVEYRMLPLPDVDGRGVVTTYGGGFSINAAAPDPKTAMDVIAVLTDATAQEAIVTMEVGFVPAMTEFAETYREATPEYAAFTDEVLASGRTLDYPLQTAEFGNALIAGFQGLVAGNGSTAQELLSDLQAQFGQ